MTMPRQIKKPKAQDFRVIFVVVTSQGVEVKQGLRLGGSLVEVNLHFT